MMNLAWLMWCVLSIVFVFLISGWIEKRRPLNTSSSLWRPAAEGLVSAASVILMAFGPIFLIEFPRTSAIVSDDPFQEDVPVSFENGVVTPHPWGAWNPTWDRRVMELPSAWLNMVSFAPGQKGATYQVRNKEVGWLTVSYNISVFIDDHKTFFSLPERQSLQWDDKTLRGRIISDFLDIVDERKAPLRWFSEMSAEEVHEFGVRSEVPEISTELVRRLGPLADGLRIRTTSTVLGPFREF